MKKEEWRKKENFTSISRKIWLIKEDWKKPHVDNDIVYVWFFSILFFYVDFWQLATCHFKTLFTQFDSQSFDAMKRGSTTYWALVVVVEFLCSCQFACMLNLKVKSAASKTFLYSPWTCCIHWIDRQNSNSFDSLMLFRFTISITKKKSDDT